MCPLSALERWPSYRDYSYSKTTGKRQGPTPGVRFREGRLIEVSIRRELTVLLNGMRGRENTDQYFVFVMTAGPTGQF